MKYVVFLMWLNAAGTEIGKGEKYSTDPPSRAMTDCLTEALKRNRAADSGDKKIFWFCTPVQPVRGGSM